MTKANQTHSGQRSEAEPKRVSFEEAFKPQPLPVYMEPDLISKLIAYCQANHLSRFLLVADQNTYPALGASVEAGLRAAELDCSSVILHGEEVIANEQYIVQVLLKADREKRTYLAVGSGTITDITRFVSHRTQAAFIALPTAASVDGFTSVGAPLVIQGLKQTYICHPPMALFADLHTLAAAPPLLSAAGFGDIMGKFMSIADWKLGHVLWDERYDEKIAQQFYQAAQSCTEALDAIGSRSLEGMRILMDALIAAGFGMLEFGNSTPASGAEHHMSHFWEMKLLREKRPAVLHGAKVGIASILTAQRYQSIRRFTRWQVANQLQWSHLATREKQIEEIQAAYGSISGQLIQEQALFLDLTEREFGLLRGRIIDCWPEVQEIADTVPTPEQLIGWFKRVGAPSDGESIGLSDQVVKQALAWSHHLRKRFTINKLWLLLGLPSTSTRS
jgi:glycerol-1-phosphate dehydrogenase [NAD(P)+]